MALTEAEVRRAFYLAGTAYTAEAVRRVADLVRTYEALPVTFPPRYPQIPGQINSDWIASEVGAFTSWHAYRGIIDVQQVAVYLKWRDFPCPF